MNFSVVIPLYNKSYSIARCIDSVLTQNHLPLEVIIVNDGSTDDSMSIVDTKYANEIKKGFIRIVEQPNKGVSISRNVGVEIARSEYICFLDADDEWLSGFLEKMYLLVSDYPNADLYALAHMVRKGSLKLTKPRHGLPNNHRGYVNDFFKCSSKGSVANSSKVCIKKQSLKSVGGFPEGVVAGEDLYVWIMLALKGNVACDMCYLSIVNYESDSSRVSRKSSVPYPLVFFSENKNLLRSKSLDRYLFIIFYKHFLRSILDLKFEEASNRLKKYIEIYLKIK